MNRTLSEKLADFVCQLETSCIPEDVRDRAKMRALDFLGVALAGSRISSSRIMGEVVKELGGTQESVIIGQGRKTSSVNAALANGTMAHASDFDDDHRSSTMHPGAVVLPAALSLGEKQRCNGSHFIASVVAGYEVACRVGDAFLGNQYHEGFHPTGTCGVFGSAAAAAKILGLSPEETVSALGIAGTQAAGLEEWKADGSWIKRLHPGKAAQSGILAALLARKGFTGPATIFEGKYGFLNAFSFERIYSTDKITHGLGDVFVGHATAFKPYPCCRFLHQVIDGVLDVVNTENLTPDMIDTVSVKTFNVGIETLMKPVERRYRPQTIVDAQFSIPFVVGAAVVRRRVSLQEFTEESIQDPDILRIAAKVVGDEDPEYTKKYPERFPTSIEIGLKNKQILSRYVDLPSGDPAKEEYADDPSRFNEAVVEKFIHIVSDIPPFSNRADEIVMFVRDLEHRGDISKLMQWFIPGP